MDRITSYLLSKHFLRNVLLEFGPIGIFVFFFYTKGPYFATLILMVTTLASIFLTYTIEKRIPLIALYVTFLTLIFGYMTLHKHNIRFLQIRDTIYDITLAITILLGFFWNKNVLKIALGSVIPLSDRVWNYLAFSWAGFFIVVACINEYVRRMYPIHTWLDYKIVMMFVTSIFGITILYYFNSRDLKSKK